MRDFHLMRSDRDKWKAYSMKVRSENTSLKIRLKTVPTGDREFEEEVWKMDMGIYFKGKIEEVNVENERLNEMLTHDTNII